MTVSINWSDINAAVDKIGDDICALDLREVLRQVGDNVEGWQPTWSDVMRAARAPFGEDNPDLGRLIRLIAVAHRST